MKQRMTFFIATVASITLLQVDGQAATVEHDDYSVTYQESGTQRPTARDTGYADVIAAPGSTQTLTFKIANLSDKTIKVDVTKGTAGTSENGNVVYTSENWPNTDFINLPTRMENHLTVSDPVVTLAPKESKQVTATLTMPASPIDGTIAGGVGFKEENQQRTSGAGFRLNATVKYDIAVLAQNAEPKQYAKQPTVTSEGAKTVAGKSAFVFHFQNPYPAFINRVKMDVKVTAPSGKTYRRAQNMMQFAPNSQLNWTVWLNGDKVEAGAYKVEMTGSAAGSTTLTPGAVTNSSSTDASDSASHEQRPVTSGDHEATSLSQQQDSSSVAPDNELTVPADTAQSATSQSTATKAKPANNAATKRLSVDMTVPISTAEARKLNAADRNVAGAAINPIFAKLALLAGTALGGFGVWFVMFKRQKRTVAFYTADYTLVAQHDVYLSRLLARQGVVVPEGYLAIDQNSNGEDLHDAQGQPVLVSEVEVYLRRDQNAYTVVPI